ncbi:methyltransferase [Streptomyces sp. SBT349]|uniref:methyltransferase n=1 Tax=Streptomyces sp. SBT349 TaxID=1580539 RepID=UPI00066C840F|nr:methyltransferase [Streptomyces sp. SBT349]
MKADLKATQQAVELITGGWRAQALYTSVKLGLPDHIEAGLTTTAELAAASGAEEEGIRRLMRLLVAMGVFEGGERAGYRNTPVSATLLNRPESLRDMCLLYGEEFYTAWGHAHEAIRTVTAGFEAAYGQPLYAYLSQDEDASDRFQRAMKAGNLFFDWVPEIFDFSGGKLVVDVGGGGGQLLAAILGATPDARGSWLDREHVVPIARENLAATVGLDRVELTGGDMFKAVPRGGDVYLLCRVLAGWDDDAVVGVFENCRRAMAGPSSRLLILERVVADEDSTVLPALWDLHLLMTNGGRHRSLDRFTTLLDRAGLDVERVAELPVETTALIAAPRP